MVINPSFQRIGTFLVFKIPNEVNIYVSREYSKFLKDEYAKENFQFLVLDATGDFILSSLSFGFIMNLYNFCNLEKVELRLICNREKVLQMFDLMKIGHMFKLYSSLEQALVE
ncbi:MAG: STAS domain-containing protein [Leptospiraceae bacterium]|nr:STAS domain-containing protein [Leptospiraceae bacterium]